MKSKLKNHELLHIYPNPQTCSLPNCGLVFKTEDDLNKHEESHQQRFKCEICGKLLASEKVRVFKFDKKWFWIISTFGDLFKILKIILKNYLVQKRAQGYISSRWIRIYVWNMWQSVFKQVDTKSSQITAPNGKTISMQFV